MSAPMQIDRAKVVCFSLIDRRHRPTAACRHIVAGAVQGPAAGVAVCQYEGESGYYVFGCDAEWNAITDTWHATLEDAKSQAECEYEGLSGTWQTNA
jgi:hypothetical protein